MELLRGRDEGGVKALSNLGDQCVVISGVDSAEFSEEVESSRIGGGIAGAEPVEEDRLRVISSKLIFLFVSGVAEYEVLTRCWMAGLAADSEPPESAWILPRWSCGLGVRRRLCSLLIGDLLPLLGPCLFIVPSPTTTLGAGA